jgi:hypothetical protein
MKRSANNMLTAGCGGDRCNAKISLMYYSDLPSDILSEEQILALFDEINRKGKVTHA